MNLCSFDFQSLFKFNIFLLKKSSTYEKIFTALNDYFNKCFLELLEPKTHVLWTNLEVCACQAHEKKVRLGKELEMHYF
jgi:hypothetical protein